MGQPRKPPKDGSQEAPCSDAHTTSTGFFRRKRGSGSAPSWLRTSKLLTLSLRLSPTALRRTCFGLLYPQSHSFWLYPKLMTMGEGWIID